MVVFTCIICLYVVHQYISYIKICEELERAKRYYLVLRTLKRPLFFNHILLWITRT